MTDIVRVLRIVEYIGPRDRVEEQIARSIHGEMRIRSRTSGPDRSNDGDISIRATTLGEFPDILGSRELHEWRKPMIDPKEVEIDMLRGALKTIAEHPLTTDAETDACEMQRAAMEALQ